MCVFNLEKDLNLQIVTKIIQSDSCVLNFVRFCPFTSPEDVWKCLEAFFGFPQLDVLVALNKFKEQ